jgi:hypothetical protein
MSHLGGLGLDRDRGKNPWHSLLFLKSKLWQKIFAGSKDSLGDAVNI